MMAARRYDYLQQYRSEHCRVRSIRARRSLAYTCATLFCIACPIALCPPRSASFDKWANLFNRAFLTSSGRRAPGYDVEAVRLRVMLVNISSDAADEVGVRHIARTRFVPLRDDPIPSERAPHRFFFGPYAHNPDRHSRRLHCGRKHGHLFNVVMLAFEADRLACPEPRHYLKPFV